MEKTNVHFFVEAKMVPELKVDQSISHNGVCLTVVKIENDYYQVTAVEETLRKTNLSQLEEGALVNLERGMKLGSRLDGHIVQGHVDQTAVCVKKAYQDGSWEFRFRFDALKGNVTIEKGSITVDGVSLTVVDSNQDEFSVAIIPYTYEHTLFKFYEKGTVVNLEFDVIGKYVSRLLSR